MKIKSDSGAEIFLSKRRDNGVIIIQGKSRIWLSESEAANVAVGLHNMTKGGQ